MRHALWLIIVAALAAGLAGCQKEEPKKDATHSAPKTSGTSGSEKGLFERGGAATDRAVDKTREVGSEAWETTKEKTGEAWDKTKEVTGKAVDTTKEKTGEAWDKTKEVTGKAVDTTKEKTGEAWDTTKEKTGAAVTKTREVTGEGIKKVGEWVAPDKDEEK